MIMRWCTFWIRIPKREGHATVWDSSLSIKMPCYQCGDSHYKKKVTWRPCHLYKSESLCQERQSSYWDGAFIFTVVFIILAVRLLYTETGLFVAPRINAIMRKGTICRSWAAGLVLDLFFVRVPAERILRHYFCSNITLYVGPLKHGSVFNVKPGHLSLQKVHLYKVAETKCICGNRPNF